MSEKGQKCGGTESQHTKTVHKTVDHLIELDLYWNNLILNHKIGINLLTHKTGLTEAVASMQQYSAAEALLVHKNHATFYLQTFLSSDKPARAREAKREVAQTCDSWTSGGCHWLDK